MPRGWSIKLFACAAVMSSVGACNREPSTVPARTEGTSQSKTTAKPGSDSVDQTDKKLSIGNHAVLTERRMKNVDGKEIAIADLGGEKGILVIFTCNHCPFAKAWEARIAELGNTYKKRGVGVIAVNSNDPSEHEEDNFEGMVARAKTLKLEFPYVVDDKSELARAFGATRTPEAFLFDRSMKLVYHGTIDDNAQEPGKVREHYLKDALEHLVAGTAIANAETKAIGCTIKFHDAA